MYLNIYERLMTFCSGGVVLAVTFILAEFCWRFGRFLSEIYFYSKHYKYNEKYRTALRHAFTFSRASSILMLTVAAVAATSTMYNGVLEQSHLLVIWWVFRYTGFTEYMYDYSDFIRSDSGLDGASAMVHGYFHAYLKLILPRSSTTEGKKEAVAVIIIVVAEFIWRFAKFLSEIFIYSKQYPYKKKLSTALSYGFTFSIRSRYLLGVVALIALQLFNRAEIYDDIQEQCYLLPVWWVFRYTKFTESLYDYSDLIRSDSGIDYGSGMAASYYHGYIKLIVPRNCISEGIVQRIERYESQHRVQFAAKRLFILIPNSLHTKPVIESRLMERQDGQPLEGVIRDRAGVSRPYINSVYRILIENQPYYITIEGATPLLSYYDALNHGITTTEKMKAMRREIMIKFYRYLKTILQECPETQDLCELVLYNDYTADGQLQDVGEVLSVHIQQMWERMPAEQRPQ